MALLHRNRTSFVESAADDGWSSAGSISVGEVLRERRAELGLSIDDIAQGLRIKPAYLAALEQGRLDELPGPTYAIGFVRAYSDYLGLDVDETLWQFKAETAAFDARPDLTFPVPLAERSLPGGAMLLVALILVLCGYGTWYYLSTGERSRPERVTEVPAPLRVGKPDPGAGEAAAAGVTGTSTPPAPSGITAGTTGGATGIGSAQAATPPVAAAPAVAVPPGYVPSMPQGAPAAATGGPAAAAPAAASSATRVATAGGTSRIVIHASADCWIQVRDADQSTIFSRVLKAGETYRVPQRTGLSMRTGNAGVLDISVDGRNVPGIGAVGALRRNVSLDPDALAAGTAVKG